MMELSKIRIHYVILCLISFVMILTANANDFRLAAAMYMQDNTAKRLMEFDAPTPCGVRLSEMDFLYLNKYGASQFKYPSYLQNSAYLKRKCAIILGRETFFYSLLNYDYGSFNRANLSHTRVGPAFPEILLCMGFDGVSNVLYNTSYLCSTPVKMIRCHQISNGVGEWLINEILLLLGAVASIIMLFIGFFVGFICHPFETISNLVFPIYFMAPSGIFTFGGYHREMWWNYLLHTNFFASLWDLIWNSIIMPLGEIFK